jgi:N-acetyl-alpha-D-muramate 1-phosphate uridylyltransferase
MLPVVVLTGGLATRLYPVTRSIPKALIPINGRPFIDHQLTLLKEKGIVRVILCVGNLGNLIEDFVGDGSRWGMKIQYSYDGNSLLGTGGAIKKATSCLPDIFMILYGDSYLDIDFTNVIQEFSRQDLPVLMTVYHNHNKLGQSNILMMDGKIIKYDKKNHDPAMEFIDYGLIIIRREVFEQYPTNNPFDLSMVLSKMVNDSMVTSYESMQRFFEIGSPQGIKDTEEYIKNRTQNSHPVKR